MERGTLNGDDDDDDDTGKTGCFKFVKDTQVTHNLLFVPTDSIKLNSTRLQNVSCRSKTRNLMLYILCHHKSISSRPYEQNGS